MKSWEDECREMVATQVAARGVSDERVLDAMRSIPRHRFVGRGMEQSAYSDHALPIGEGQTISQPYMVALMTEALGLTGSEKVLEIGTGSGYQTAVLASLADRVFSVERVEALARRARGLLDELGFHNVSIRVGDGTIGWKEFEPYDRIIVTAGSPEIPRSLLDQLADPGILVIPVGPAAVQQLLIIERRDGRIAKRTAGGCSFVPLLGREGWSIEEEEAH